MRRIPAKVLLLLLAVIWSASPVAIAFTDAEENAFPGTQWSARVLPGNPISADISPDESLVVILSTDQTIPPSGADFRSRVGVVEISNLQTGAPLARFVTSAGTASATGNPVPARTGIVRFSPDGSYVFALIDAVVYVLRVSGLGLVRAVSLDSPPASIAQSYRGTDVVSRIYIRSLEISPDGGRFAILWVSDFTFGRIDVYGVPSGNRLGGWITPPGWIASSNGLHWHPTRDLLLVAIPAAVSCDSSRHQPDIFAFDAQSGISRYQLTSGFAVPRIAVTNDNRVLVVAGDCIRPTRKSLKVFDLDSGKLRRDGSARVSGVGDSISVSSDGSRILAYRGKFERKFDWGDFQFYDRGTDRKFSVWNLPSYDLVATSQNIPGLDQDNLRLSPRGHYVISLGKPPRIFRLP